jgi:hypothetical protein
LFFLYYIFFINKFYFFKVEIAVREINENEIYRTTVALKPNKNWSWFKMRLSGQLVAGMIVEGVGEVYLDTNLVNDEELVPDDLKAKSIEAFVTFSVFLYYSILSFEYLCLKFDRKKKRKKKRRC